MSTNRFPFQLDAVVLGCLLLMAVGARPIAAQASGSIEIDVRLSETGTRMIGETEKNLVDVLGTVTIHLTQARVGDVVLVVPADGATRSRVRVRPLLLVTTQTGR